MRTAPIAAALAALASIPALLPAHAAPARPPEVAAPTIQPGERWTYRELEAYGMRREVGRWVLSADGTLAAAGAGASAGPAAAAASSRMALAPAATAGRLSSQLPPGRYDPALQLRPYPLAVGQRWSQQVRMTDESGVARTVRLNGRVVGWERARVPAGEFDALRIERELYLGDAGRYRGETRRIEEEWYVPELKAAVRLSVWEQATDPTVSRTLQHTLVNRELFELVEHRPAR